MRAVREAQQRSGRRHGGAAAASTQRGACCAARRVAVYAAAMSPVALRARPAAHARRFRTDELPPPMLDSFSDLSFSIHRHRH